MKIKLEDAVTYELRTGTAWEVEFEGQFSSAFPKIGGSNRVPVSNVTMLDVTPIINETTIGPEIPLIVVEGWKPPTEVNITFLENDALEFKKAYREFVKLGKGDSLMLSRVGLTPSEIKALAMKLRIFEYSSTGKQLDMVELLVIPKDPISVSLDSNSDAVTNQVAFAVIGSNYNIDGETTK